MPNQREDEGSENERDEEQDESSNEEDDDDDDEVDDVEEEFEDEEKREQKPIYDADDPYDEYGTTKGASSTRLSHSEEEERNYMPLILGICCCLCLIIVAVLLGVLLPKHLKKDSNNNDPSTTAIDQPTEVPNQAPFNPVSFPTPPPGELPPSGKPPPTLFPTISPAPSASPITVPTPQPTEYPTTSPTISPAPTKSVPETLGIISDQDTTVYLDGFYVGESYGNDPTVLVQKGLAGKEEVPDAVALLTFPLDEVPAFDRLESTKKNAVLRLYHEPTEPERGSATYTIVRMPSTAMQVEFLHGYIFKPPKDDDEGVVVGPEFTVNPDTTEVDVDITSLLFDTDDDQQLFLMLQDRGPDQPEGGDRFYSREHPEFKPQLLIDFVGGNAADVEVDTNPGGEASGGDGEAAQTPPPGEGEDAGDAEQAETPVSTEEDPETGNSGGDVESTTETPTPAIRSRRND